MKNLTPIVAVLLFAGSAGAVVFPLAFEDKCKKADLIVRGTVVSISRLMPDNGFGSDEVAGFDGTPGSYTGPRSIAVVEVTDTAAIKNAAMLNDAGDDGEDIAVSAFAKRTGIAFPVELTYLVCELD